MRIIFCSHETFVYSHEMLLLSNKYDSMRVYETITTRSFKPSPLKLDTSLYFGITIPKDGWALHHNKYTSAYNQLGFRFLYEYKFAELYYKCLDAGRLIETVVNRKSAKREIWITYSWGLQVSQAVRKRMTSCYCQNHCPQV